MPFRVAAVSGMYLVILAAGDLIRQLVINRYKRLAYYVVVDGDNLSLVGLGVLAELQQLLADTMSPLEKLNLGR